ncbi:MAG: gliding motility-associated C-terminal domain-containing protein [Sphingobacteriia bacterium]|nr:gliding motility-associated C-terminal domain-containing protein [Sphingobacteriia bacterium]
MKNCDWQKYPFFLIWASLFNLSFVGGFAQSSNIKGFQFFENSNQWPAEVTFRAEVPDGALFLTATGITYSLYKGEDLKKIHRYYYNHPPSKEPAVEVSSWLNHHSIKMKFIGDLHPRILSYDTLPQYHNYFIGNDPAHWASNVKGYCKVVYDSLYPGVRWIVHSDATGLKYDFELEPGVDPHQIQYQIEGADSLSIQEGNLIIHSSTQNLKEGKPIAWQVVQNQKRLIPCNYKLSNNIISYDFPEGYDSQYALVIDPTVVFSTFSGSTADNWGFTATYDTAGNLYSGGTVYALGFPVTPGAYQVNFASGPPPTGNMPVNNCDMGILKYSTTGNTLLYATYLGGFGGDYPHSLFVNDNNELLILGTTGAADFPVTPGAFDITHNGQFDIVVAKLNLTGNQLLSSTFVGGSGHDGINNTGPFVFPSTHPLHYQYADDFRGEIQADAAGNVYVASCTQSANFPVTNGAYQTIFSGGTLDACAFKLNNNLSTLTWCTYLGGSGEDAAYALAITPAGEVYLSGGTTSANFPTRAPAVFQTFQGGQADGFVVELNTAGNTMLAGTFLGTANYDQSYFIQRDVLGNIFVCGQTAGGTFPVANTLYSIPGGGQFICRLDPALSSFVWSSTFGTGNNLPNVSPTAFLVDQCGYIYFAGWGGLLGNGSTIGLPVTPNAFQSNTDGSDFYLTVFDRDMASLSYASYIGGNLSADHVDGGTSRFDRKGIVYHAVCGGCGGQSDFPTTTGVWSPTNNSTNCNNAAFKIDFGFIAYPPKIVRPQGPGVVGDTLVFTAGSQSCYTFLLTDDNPGDSLTVTYGGDLLGAGSMPSPFAVSNNDSGPTPLASQICWTPNCTQAAGIYELPVYVQDNTACPFPLNATDTLYIKILQGPPIGPPEIRCVSITGPNQITLTWINPTPTPEGYQSTFIYRNAGTGWILYDSILNPAINTYVDNNASQAYTQRYSYRLSATRECPGNQESNPGNEAQSILCDAGLITSVNSWIRWNPYLVWAAPVYSLEADSGVLFQVRGSITDTFDQYLNCRFNGNFRVQTVDPVTGCTVYSGYSPIVIHQDSIPEPPLLCRVSVLDGDKGVEVNWKLNASLDVQGYYIFRRTWDTESSYSILDSLVGGGIQRYEDEKTSVDNHRYCYKVGTYDACYNIALSADTACTILLTATEKEYSVMVDWTSYTGWPSGVERYQLWTAPNSYKNYRFLYGGDNTTRQFEDEDIYRNQPRFCYRAIGVVDTGSLCGKTSWSNEQCVEYRPYLQAANAFTPNGDGINDFFTLSHYFLDTYRLLIFDRWGNLIYESVDKTTHWDGTNEGAACQEGVYIFTAEGTGYNGYPLFKRGTVTLIR